MAILFMVKERETNKVRGGAIPTETNLILVFAGTLIVGAILILFSPLIYKLVSSGSWRTLLLLAIPIIVLSLLALAVVNLANTHPFVLAPIIGVVFGMRSISPSLTYFKIRDRFELAPFWKPVKIALAIVFIGFPVYLAYILLNSLFSSTSASSDAVILSERLLMAVGTSLVFMRLYVRFIPQILSTKLVVWLSAVLISLSFAVVAPYAFPGFEIYYTISGIVGWATGFIVLWRSL